MPESVGFSQPHRQSTPRPAPVRPRSAAPLVAEDARRMLGDRMQIRKTSMMPQPRWSLVGAVLLFVAVSVGLGIGLGGATVAIGLGLGWLSIALVALVWRDLALILQLAQTSSR